MTTPAIGARRIGTEQRAIALVDGFHPDPDGLRAFALAQPFTPARNHYPGRRAPLPGDYFQQIRPALTTVLRDVFGARSSPKLIDASFSIVTKPADALTVEQRLPHFDALQPGRVALVHYLAPESGGTAFYRHRATGYETIDEGRSASYFQRLNDELKDAAPAGYIADGGALFERTALVEARFNRAAIYASAMLHSGAIAEPAPDPDPATGRLTVTAFLSIAA